MSGLPRRPSSAETMSLHNRTQIIRHTPPAQLPILLAYARQLLPQPARMHCDLSPFSHSFLPRCKQARTNLTSPSIPSCVKTAGFATEAWIGIRSCWLTASANSPLMMAAADLLAPLLASIALSTSILNETTTYSLSVCAASRARKAAFGGAVSCAYRASEYDAADVR